MLFALVHRLTGRFRPAGEAQDVENLEAHQRNSSFFVDISIEVDFLSRITNPFALGFRAARMFAYFMLFGGH